MQALNAIATGVGKSIPLAGTPLSIASLGVNVKQLSDQYKAQDGKVNADTTLQAASDVVSIAGTIAATIAAGTVAAPVTAPLIIGTAVVAAALTVASLTSSAQSSTIDGNAILGVPASIKDAIGEMNNSIQAAASQLSADAREAVNDFTSDFNNFANALD